jgi:hypothetical protein
MYSHKNARAHLHILGQLNTFLARRLGARVKAVLGPAPTAELEGAVVAAFAAIGWD